MERGENLSKKDFAVGGSCCTYVALRLLECTMNNCKKEKKDLWYKRIGKSTLFSRFF